MKQKKAVIFFSAGLGDALLLVPLVKQLKKKSYSVTGFFNSDMPCRELLENTGLLDEVIDANSKKRQALVSIKKMGGYDVAFLNYFAANKKNLLTASLIAKEIVTNREVKGFKNPGVKITLLKPEENIHDAIQNLLLDGDSEFSLEDLSIPSLPRVAFDLPQNYFALQVSSGNIDIAYKNWPLQNWKEFLSFFFSKYDQPLVLLGNKSDETLAEELKKQFGDKIISLAGKTDIKELMQVISNCELFLGLDGGIMHLAAAYGKPTFTIWGPSSEKLYGYEQFNAKKHRCVRHTLNCFPCNAWIGPNTSKTTAPELCPDHACLKELGAKEVFNQFEKFTEHVR